MNVFERVTSPVFYANFLNRRSEQASIVGTPTITITHILNGTTVTDVATTNMTLKSGSNYFYEHYLGPSAYKGIYTAEYSSVYADGSTVIGSEDFQVVDKNSFSARNNAFTSRIVQVFSKSEKDNLMKAMKEVENLFGEKEFKGNINNLGKVFLLVKEMDKSKKDIVKLSEKINDNNKIIKRDIQKLSREAKSVRNVVSDGNSKMEYFMVKNLDDESLEEILYEQKVAVE